MLQIKIYLLLHCVHADFSVILGKLKYFKLLVLCVI